jgi:hypothetical protein
MGLALEHGDLRACLGELIGTGKTGEPTAEDDYALAHASADSTGTVCRCRLPQQLRIPTLGSMPN